MSYKYVKLNGVNLRMGTQAKTYTAAADDCQEHGGFLAKISTAQELTALQLLNGKLTIKLLGISLVLITSYWSGVPVGFDSMFSISVYKNLQDIVKLMTIGQASPTQMESPVLMITVPIN